MVDDLIASNSILYAPNEHPDHTIVIKYVPSVADSKRAMDEYVSSIFMGGKSTIAVYNVCEDSLLAAPLIVDLVVMCELFTRIRYRTAKPTVSNSRAVHTDSDGYMKFHPVLSILSYMLKAPMVPSGTPVVNALSKQRNAIENVLRACLGLAPTNDMGLEYRCI